MSIKQVPVRRMKVADLVKAKAAWNPRQITDAKRTRLHGQLEAWGDVGVIVYNERSDEVLSGHQRIDVFDADGVDEVDVKVVDLDEADARALAIALNEHAGEWDFSALGRVLEDIKGLNKGSLKLTGLSGGRIKELTKSLNLEGLKKTAPKGKHTPPEHACPSCGHAFYPSKETIVTD